MPFASAKQRRWMHKNNPKMAEEWEEEEAKKPKPKKAARRKRATKK